MVDMLVGNKPIRKYLLYALTIPNMNELTLKARGRSITKAVDLAEILKRKLPELVVKDVVIDTAVIKDKKTQKELRVSTMEITLVKKNA